MTTLRCLLVLFLGTAPLFVSAESESISVNPGSPTNADMIELELSALTHTDCDFAEFQSANVVGNQIDLVVFLPLIETFAMCNVVPTPFNGLVTIGPLPAGQYQLHWTYIGWQADTYPTYSQTLTIAQGTPGGIAAAALPSSSITGLALLALMLGVCAWFAFSRKIVG